MRIKIFVILLIITNGLNSQTTFNKDLNIMKYINQAGSVLTYDDTIICIGYGTDHNPYRFYKAFMAKLDMDGNFVKRYLNYDSDYTHYDYQENNSSFFYKDKIITAVDVLARDSTDGIWKITFMGGYLMISDIATGKIDKRIKFSTPQGDKKWQLVDGFTKIDSITYAVVSTIDEPNKKYLDAQISIINIETEEVKYIQFGRKKVSDPPFTVIWTGDKLLVGSYYSYPDYDPAHPWNKITYYTLIYEVDTTGAVNEVFVSDTMRSPAFEMVMDKDGNFIYQSLYVKYHYNAWKDRYYKRFHFSIVKLDHDYNLLWEHPCGLKYDFTGYNGRYGKVILSTEGDGYIVALSQANYPWNITWAGRDSMRKAGISPMMVGVLSKFSKEGDDVWTRSYSVVSDTSVGGIEHIIKDVTYAPDGGYVIYGDVSNIKNNGDTFGLIHAWLFKVDEYGCFVPGCQEGDSTKVDEIYKGLDIKLYPNPANEVLYVYQSQSGKVRYTITDILGRKTKEWTGSLPNHTYIIDVKGYNPGMYILSVQIDNKLYSKKFLVE